MSTTSAIAWGATRFEYNRTDVEKCVKLIENNKYLLPAHGVSSITEAMALELSTEKPYDTGLMMRWVEQIIHLYCADVQNIPGFLCDTENPYRFPSSMRILDE